MLLNIFHQPSLSLVPPWSLLVSPALPPRPRAIALSHPLAATGARIMSTLVHSLKRRGGGVGLGTACIGGGQGIALIVEGL